MKRIRIGGYVFTLLSWAVFFLVDFLWCAVYDESGKDEVFLIAFGPLSYLWPLALYAALAISTACSIFVLVLAFKKRIRPNAETETISALSEAQTARGIRIVAYVFSLLASLQFLLLDFLLRKVISDGQANGGHYGELFGPLDYFQPLALRVAIAVSVLCALSALFATFEKWVRA